jgi:hypothetical protein
MKRLLCMALSFWVRRFAQQTALKGGRQIKGLKSPFLRLLCTHKFLIFCLTFSSPLNPPMLGDFEPVQETVLPPKLGGWGGQNEVCE